MYCEIKDYDDLVEVRKLINDVTIDDISWLDKKIKQTKEEVRTNICLEVDLQKTDNNTHFYKEKEVTV